MRFPIIRFKALHLTVCTKQKTNTHIEHFISLFKVRLEIAECSAQVHTENVYVVHNNCHLLPTTFTHYISLFAQAAL